jgi:ABC-2 type transport system permease protein
MNFIRLIFDSRFWSLALKEISQMRRNKQLIFLLTVSPILQLLIFGFALSPDVNHLKLGIVDYAQVPVSRELISAMTENQVFIVDGYSPNQKGLGQEVREGTVDIGLVIPPEFNSDLRTGNAKVQVLVDGVNAYTAGVASGYISQIVSQFNRRLLGAKTALLINPQIIFRYNPGLIGSWFFVPGVIGVILTLTSSLAAAVEAVREKDEGTLEQLLMTPASSLEILLAKVVPLYVLLMGDVLLSLTLARIIFSLPLRGSFLLFFLISGLYVLIGISIGILMATFSRNKQQTILTSFFINSPMIMVSGALSATESMPAFFRILALFNPLYHYMVIVRGILLKGIGLNILYPHVIALIVFAILLLSTSAVKFRSQLS